MAQLLTSLCSTAHAPEAPPGASREDLPFLYSRKILEAVRLSPQKVSIAATRSSELLRRLMAELHCSTPSRTSFQVEHDLVLFVSTCYSAAIRIVDFQVRFLADFETVYGYINQYSDNWPASLPT